MICSKNIFALLFCIASLLMVETIHCAELAPEPANNKAEFKRTLEETLKRNPLGRSKRTESAGPILMCEPKTEASSSKSKSTSPSLKRSLSRKLFSPRISKKTEQVAADATTEQVIEEPKAEELSRDAKLTKQINEIIERVEKDDDINEKRAGIARGLALLLKPHWDDTKKVSAKDVELYRLFLESSNKSLQVFSGYDNPMEFLPIQTIAQVKKLLNLPLASNGSTLLLEAAKRPGTSGKLLENLLLLGADAKGTDIFGNTVFHYIAKGPECDKQAIAEAIVLFAKYGADINKADENGKTPLDWAIKFDSKNIKEVFECNGAKIGEPKA